MLRRLALDWVVLAIAVSVTAVVLPGIHFTGDELTVLWIGAPYALANHALGALRAMVAPPLGLPEFVLCAFVVNLGVFALVDVFSSSLTIHGTFSAVPAAAFVTAVTVVLARTEDHRERPAP